SGLSFPIVGHSHQQPDPPHALALLRACRERPRGRAAKQGNELATFQLIEWHFAPASQGQIAGYRIDHSQSAAIPHLVNKWPVPLRHRQGRWLTKNASSMRPSLVSILCGPSKT